MAEPKWSQAKEVKWQARGGEARLYEAKTALLKLNARIVSNSQRMDTARQTGQYNALKRLATETIHYSNEREAWNRFLDHFASERETYFNLERQLGFTDGEILARLQPGKIITRLGCTSAGKNRWVASNVELTKDERDAIHGKWPVARSNDGKATVGKE